MKVRVGQPCAILGVNHAKSFPYDDKLIVEPEPEISEAEATTITMEPELELELAKWHVLATDGSFMYVSGGRGKGLSKIGTGLYGTIQGYVYNVNQNIEVDFVAFGTNMLIAGYVSNETSL
jgi:E3 ubiquitin-protein ligase HECTD4